MRDHLFTEGAAHGESRIHEVPKNNGLIFHMGEV